ncbi:MAG: hypothetical protein C0614_02855 [Desulfuromonas sp.]|nr:MAG: hypothetical protein C0614_02855 [Desulfuromonas sp.]
MDHLGGTLVEPAPFIGSWTPHPSSLKEILATVEDLSASWQLPPKPAMNLMLTIEELVVNIINYSEAAEDSHISLEITRHPSYLDLRISDQGKPFNPLDLENPDIDVNLKERKVGGLGVFFIKKIVDQIDYQRLNSTNQIHLRILL